MSVRDRPPRDPGQTVRRGAVAFLLVGIAFAVLAVVLFTAGSDAPAGAAVGAAAGDFALALAAWLLSRQGGL